MGDSSGKAVLGMLRLRHPQECPEVRMEHLVPAWGSEGEEDSVEGCFFNHNPSSSLSPWSNLRLVL